MKQDDSRPAPEWRWLNYNSVHNAMREFLERADRIGELKKGMTVGVMVAPTLQKDGPVKPGHEESGYSFVSSRQ